jgi:cation:H+ antiporter
VIDFSQYGVWINVAIFAGAAVAVWFAGSRVANCTDELAERLNLSRALLGVLLLAFVTSLPEIATSFTAARADNAAMAVNNLLGSIAMQVAVLALADLAISKRPLTSVVPDPVVLLQGAVNVGLLSLVAMAIVVGDRAFWAGGYWTWGLGVAAVYGFIKVSEGNRRYPWIVNPDDKEVSGKRNDQQEGEEDRPMGEYSMTRLVGETIVSALVILVAGYVVATVGDALAKQTGLGASFVGVALVAIATSLPEASSVFASVKRGLYTMAISGILGTNILNVLLLFGVDMVASGEPVLNKVGAFATVGALLGAVVTAIFLIGLSERRDRRIWRMGTDSAAVLVLYLGGLYLLYTMRGQP